MLGGHTRLASRVLLGVVLAAFARPTLLAQITVVPYSGNGNGFEWSDPDNWDGLDPTSNRAEIIGPFNVEAETDTVDAFRLGGQAGLEIIGDTVLTTLSNSRSNEIGWTGLGTLEIAENGRFNVDGNRIFWIGDQQNQNGVVDLSGNGVLNAPDSPVQLGLQSDASLFIADDAQFICADLRVGHSAPLANLPVCQLEISGGTLIVGTESGTPVLGEVTEGDVQDFEVTANVTEFNVEMSGGLLDVPTITWAAPDGCFRFSGGTIVLDGDQQDIVNSGWLKASPDMQVSYDLGNDETTLTVAPGSAPAPQCTDCIATPCDDDCAAPSCTECPERGDCIDCASAPQVPPCAIVDGSYIGMGADPNAWGDSANWDTAGANVVPTGYALIDQIGVDPFTPYVVNGITTVVQELEVAGGSTLTLAGTTLLETTGPLPSYVGKGDRGTEGPLSRLVIQDDATWLHSAGPRLWFGDRGADGDAGSAPAEVSVEDNGTLRVSGFGLVLGTHTDTALISNDSGTINILGTLEFANPDPIEGGDPAMVFNPTISLTVNGGTVTAPRVFIYQNMAAGSIDMNGGELNIDSIQFCTGDRDTPGLCASDPSGGTFPFTFNFAGGIVKLDGDQTSIIGESWFSGAPDTQATIRGTRTWITVGPPPPLACEDPANPEYFGGTADPSDWGENDNWAGCDPTDRDVNIGTPLVINAVTDSINSLDLGGGGTLVVSGSEKITDFGLNAASHIGEFGGMGTLQVNGDGEYLYDSGRLFWIGDPTPTNGNPNAGALEVSENGRLRMFGPLQLTTCADSSLSIADNGLVDCSSLTFGALNFDPCPGVENRTAVLAVSGGRLLVTNDLTVTSSLAVVDIDISGGEVDLGGIAWFGLAGNTLDFTGGTITITGDYTDIINQPWFNGTPDTEANIRQGRTLITVGPPPPPVCENPDSPSFTGPGADWADNDNWGLCEPTDKDVRIGDLGAFTVDAVSDSVASVILGGGSTLSMAGSVVFTDIDDEGFVPSFVGAFGGGGTLQISGNAQYLYETVRNFWVGDPTPTEGNPNPGTVEVSNNGFLRTLGALQLTTCADSTTTIADNALVQVRNLYMGSTEGGDPCPGVDTKTAILNITGGELLVEGGGVNADGFKVSNNLASVEVNMSGGEMDLAQLDWNADVSKGSLNFSGGTIIVDGDRRDIPSQPWFNGAASASFDGTRTTITVGESQPEFRRGDHDGSGLVDITDPLNLLGFLFLGQTPPICEDASDGDNSGALDISDALNVLGFLFLGSFPLNATLPGPNNCGPDPTSEIDPDGAGGFPVQPVVALGCEKYPSDVGVACP